MAIIKKTGITFSEIQDNSFTETPIFTTYRDLEKINNYERNNDMDKIFEIYKDKKSNEINKKYDKLFEELEKNDEINIILKEMEQQIRTVFENEGTENPNFSIVVTGKNITNITKEKKEKLYSELLKEKKQIEQKIKEIKALLELAPNYENKIQILRDYEIIDKKKNIIL